MKTRKTIVIILTLIFLLASCTPKATQEPQGTSTALVLETQTTPEPSPNQSLEGSTYPISSEHEVEVPPYMVPGLVTMTPAAPLTSISVSDVQHEGDVEKGYLSHISTQT